MSNALTKTLIELADKNSSRDSTHHSLFCSTESNVDDTVKEHAVSLIENKIAAKLFVLLVLAHRGKNKEPICKYDGNLQFALNNKKFFSTTIGLHFLNQGKRVLKDLDSRGFGTFLFTDIYGMQKAPDWRPRLWTLNLFRQGTTLRCTAVFGHCTLFPMLTYEIIGVCAIAQRIAEELDFKNLNWSWFFHSIIRSGKNKLEPISDMFTKFPKSNELAEFFLLEEQIRNGGYSTCPIPRIPFGQELDEFLSEVYKFWNTREVI